MMTQAVALETDRQTGDANTGVAAGGAAPIKADVTQGATCVQRSGLSGGGIHGG